MDKSLLIDKQNEKLNKHLTVFEQQLFELIVQQGKEENEICLLLGIDKRKLRKSIDRLQYKLKRLYKDEEYVKAFLILYKPLDRLCK